MSQWDWSLDGWIVLSAMLCSVAAALPGNFLVLRRMSMLGDAISHAVLPGLAMAFLLTGTRSSLAMFVGAVIVGVFTAFFSEWIRRVGRVDEGASMGVVFTTLFALGLILIVRAADSVDLDAQCVLFGSLELSTLDKVTVLGARVPRSVVTLGLVVCANAFLIALFFKELKLSSFDSALANASGMSASLLHYGLMIMVAVTAVASFESVGSVLVVAMFVVPPAVAFLWTRRLVPMIFISLVVAVLSSLFGHVAAIEVPRWFGFGSTTTSGCMAAVAGLLLLVSVLVSPHQGMIPRVVRRWYLALQILRDDVLAFVYRHEERNPGEACLPDRIQKSLMASSIPLAIVRRMLIRRGRIVWEPDGVQLTERGSKLAKSLVRSHRLWETYLSDQAGVAISRLHAKAEDLEHFTDEMLRQRLGLETDSTIDPHGRQIPEEANQEED